ncbi:MAG TPA: glycosyltransferase family A protein [Flavobacterium sp.]|nr:glycosyltransferase family A protein [Flavobacterium sp.]
MIIIYHQNNKVHSVCDLEEKTVRLKSSLVADALFEAASLFPGSLVVWCHVSQRKNLNQAMLPEIFHHKKMMASYDPAGNYLPDAIGYVDQSPFIKINKQASYPTWQMSGCVGGIYSTVLNSLRQEIKAIKNFEFFLNSIAKLAMPAGLLCYSEPRLMADADFSCKQKKASFFMLFKFVKQHYRARWVFILFLNCFIYEKQFLVFPFLKALFYKNKKISNAALAPIPVESAKRVVGEKTIDVIIPTIGRKKYLHDVLKDFRVQTHLPDKIIIVEQNPLAESTSELDFISAEDWPFEIKHIFTHQAGACNARNLALSETSSEWVFLADDDNRFDASLIEEVFNFIQLTGNEAVTTSYIQKGEKKVNHDIIQWPTFGAGNSFVKRSVLDLNEIRFNASLEFGYGEDADFGMQLRNCGIDILYLPFPEILHLKAPLGGFRMKQKRAWDASGIQPKPSPTVMLFKILHLAGKQIKGYKTILFLKYYSKQPVKNPIRYYFNFSNQWKCSVYWANQLKNRQVRS